jgi:hypothetical protein
MKATAGHKPTADFWAVRLSRDAYIGPLSSNPAH